MAKSDLDDGAWLKGIYDLAQIRCVLFSAVSGEAGEMKELSRNRISHLFRNSGVGEIFFAQPPVRRLAAGNRRYQPKSWDEGIPPVRWSASWRAALRGGYAWLSTVDVEQYEPDPQGGAAPVLSRV